LHVEFLPQIDELFSDPFNEFSRSDSSLRSRLLDLLAVLIDAGQKENVFAFEPMIARNHIGQHLFVSVADVRRRIRVIDRRGDEKRFRHTRDTLADGDRPRNLPEFCRRRVVIHV
jgi:hypothetical protein